MKHPTSTALLNHWLSIRHGRRIPDRNDIDPMAIRGVLASTFMLEVDEARPSARTYPVRVSGTRLDALFGQSVKGVGLTDLWCEKNRADLRSMAETVLDEGVPAVIGGLAAPAGDAPVAVEMLMLPLRCRGRTHARLLCSLVPMTVPTWLGLKPVEPLGLTAWRVIETPDVAVAQPRLGTAAAPGLNEAGAGHRFVVIEGGKSSGRTLFGASAQGRVNTAMAKLRDAPHSTGC
jgi:hypothetical protein